MLNAGPTRLLVAALSIAALAACTKTEQPPSKDTTADAGGTAAATASASASATASAAAPDAAAPSEADTATAAATGSGPSPKVAAKDGGATPAASGSAAAVECGTKPLPDCPLQAWMKSNANPPVMTSDAAGLATVFDKIAALAPPGYTNWASIAKDGAKAAKAGDVPAAKASCRTCHDQYKQKYKTEMRARKI